MCRQQINYVNGIGQQHLTRDGSQMSCFPQRNLIFFISSTNTGRQELLQGQTETWGVVCGMRWLLSPEPPVAGLPDRTIDTVLGDEQFITSDNQLGCFLKMVELSEQQIVAVAHQTRGQHDNPLWGMFRKGRITASNFGPVISSCNSGRTPSNSLLKTLLGE